MNDPFSIKKEQLQPRILIDLVCFCRTRVVARIYHDTSIRYHDTSVFSGMYISNEVCYLTTSIAAIHFFYGIAIILREHLKRSICQGYCVNFTTLVVTIYIVTSGLWLFREILNDMFI